MTVPLTLNKVRGIFVSGRERPAMRLVAATEFGQAGARSDDASDLLRDLMLRSGRMSVMTVSDPVPKRGEIAPLWQFMVSK